ncbi:MAG: VWA domain-containing protein, partial [Vicinamibacterales bacterium]
MTRRVLSAAALCAVLAASLTAQQAPPPSQQTPPPVFRVEVNYVEVDAIVTDAQGRVVTDLTADDFELIEDRTPQTISAFSYVNLPIDQPERPLFASAPVEPDVQTNEFGEGRIYMIVVDTLHIAPANAIKVRNAARQFIERSFGVNDVAAVVFSGRQAKDTQDFTNNKRLLLEAIDKTIGAKPVSSTVARMQELQARPGREPGGGPIADPYEFERALNARNSMDRLRVLSEFMANVRGRRKAMLLISEGVEYQMGDILASNPASGVLESVRDAIGAATRANVAIYGIDPRGLTDPGTDLNGFSFNPAADDPTLGNLGIRSAIEESRVAQDSLRQLSDETGGFAVLNQNDFASAFQRIVADNSSYYVLGYYPTNERRDGRFRNITVRVKRPGLTVRARRGYLAPRGRAPEAPTAAPGANPLTVAATEALSSPLPIAGIPMRIAVAPFRGEAPNANLPIALELGV